ncbi:DUF29 domain-containing protein [Thiococcus pfennigii]|uniref:DUF29 domain-containing protein n=1 Tax=Thiococcus pfennigii TaxID=1057 RepID=UPI001F5B067A|nr:DUF29 domain-containing protein [Thiococcus pfennigii]
MQASGTAMSQSTDYDTDYVRWLEDQARHLRAGDLDRLDRERLSEELDGMSRSERRQLRNRLIILVLHLLKMQCHPERRSRSWDVTVITQRIDIKLLLRESPSLRPTLAPALDEIYDTARRDAAQETRLELNRFPATCPFTIDQVLDDEYWPGGREGDLG